ncbi:MAG: ADOP family duplicated permease [Bryobacteraceae bacterium]|jgi:predicted permease
MFTLVVHAWRSWKSAKTVALLAATALAAGIGSATAIYTVVDAVLLRPVPWQHGERYVELFSARLNNSSKWQVYGSSWLDLLDYQQRTRSFDAYGALQFREFSLTSPGQPQHLRGLEVTPSLASSLGVAPVVGRWFGEAASEQGNVYLAVISSALWNRLGGDPKIVGQALTMDGKQYTVTGVMPAWFRLPVAGLEGAGEFRTDVWVPLNPQGAERNRDVAQFFSYARLRPGVSLAQADADVKRVAAEIAKEHPQEHRDYTARVTNLLEYTVKDIRPVLLLLFGAAGALLLITCANVAGLLLARSVTRARETAIRVALGAARWQLGLQYFVEGLLVALAGAAGGIVVSVAIVRLVLSMAADYIPRADGIGIEWTALLFAFGAAILSSALFSMAPLWQAARIMPNEALSDGVRSSAPARSRRLSRTLVAAEIALAFALLSVSAALIAHLNRLLDTSPGFDPEGLLTFSVNSSSAEYSDMARLVPYQKRLLDAVERIPGVSGAALVNHLPLAGCCYVTLLFPEGTPGGDKGVHEVNFIVISPGYFRTMRIPVLRGRGFDERDDGKGDVVGIIIDNTTARRFFRGRDALGAYARLGDANGSRLTIVGIVGDVRNRGLGDETQAEVYIPATVAPMNPLHFVVRSRLPASTLAPEIRRSIRSVAPSQPIYETQTMREIVLGSVMNERLQSSLTSFFAFAALLMAALGIYGVVSYAVRHRTVEIGTRMALGAVGRDVLGLVLGDGLRMAAYGIGIGGVVALAAAFLLKSEVFGIRMDDPRPFLYSTGIVAAVTALACFFPAWRATLVSPMVAIRDDPGSLWRIARTGARGFAKRVSGFISGPGDESAVSEGALLAEFVDSSRNAESFRQAIQLALAALRETIRCESALLLEKGSAREYRCAARVPGECEDGCKVPAGGLLVGRLRGYPYPLPLSPGDFDAWSRWAAAEKPEHLAEIECLRSTGAALAVPLLAKHEIAGILLLGPPVERAEYSAAEKRALQNCAAQFALMIENARLTDRMVEQEKLNRDIQLAAEVQKRLFPDKPPATATVTLAGVSLPARSVGGDYYDFLDLGDQRIGIALADVAGKGVAAALIMSVVQASLRILATEENVSLGTLAARMNRFLHRSTGSNAYATFFYAQIDERTRQLRYVNAGHNPPCLLRCAADRSIEELPAGGTVIGLFPKSKYEEAALDLRPGDVLMAFTDGVPEAQNPKEEEFGEERLKDLLRRSAHLPVGEMASMMSSELKDWMDNAAQYDDLTFILVKVNAEPGLTPGT